MKKYTSIWKYLAMMPITALMTFNSQAQLTLDNAIPIKSTTTGGNVVFGFSSPH